MSDLKFEFILGITVDQLMDGGTIRKHPLEAKKSKICLSNKH